MTSNQYQKGKAKSWLKGILSNRNEHEEDEQQLLVNNEMEEQSKMNELPETNSENDRTKITFLSSGQQDKITLDVATAVGNLLNDRQLILLKNKDLEEQIANSNETIIRLKNEQAKKEKAIIEKDREIRQLEEKLTNKQMNYEQLLEDYKDYQSTSSNRFENLTFELEKEISKYNKLEEDFTKFQQQSIQNMNNLEGKVRNLEVENQKLSEQYQKIIEEKAVLLQTINDFTERMSFSFSNINKSETMTPPTSSE